MKSIWFQYLMSDEACKPFGPRNCLLLIVDSLSQCTCNVWGVCGFSVRQTWDITASTSTFIECISVYQTKSADTHNTIRFNNSLCDVYGDSRRSQRSIRQKQDTYECSSANGGDPWWNHPVQSQPCSLHKVMQVRFSFLIRLLWRWLMNRTQGWHWVRTSKRLLSTLQSGRVPTRND